MKAWHSHSTGKISAAIGQGSATGNSQRRNRVMNGDSAQGGRDEERRQQEEVDDRWQGGDVNLEGGTKRPEGSLESRDERGGQRSREDRRYRPNLLFTTLSLATGSSAQVCLPSRVAV